MVNLLSVRSKNQKKKKLWNSLLRLFSAINRMRIWGKYRERANRCCAVSPANENPANCYWCYLFMKKYRQSLTESTCFQLLHVCALRRNSIKVVYFVCATLCFVHLMIDCDFFDLLRLFPKPIKLIQLFINMFVQDQLIVLSRKQCSRWPCYLISNWKFLHKTGTWHVVLAFNNGQTICRMQSFDLTRSFERHNFQRLIFIRYCTAIESNARIREHCHLIKPPITWWLKNKWEWDRVKFGLNTMPSGSRPSHIQLHTGAFKR